MNPLIQLKKATPVFLVAFGLACFGLSPQIQAVSPTPDGCYPGFTTAEGCNALIFLTTGAGNTGVGWYSLFLDTTGNFNTGVGAGTLALNTADSNTAVGAAALLLNTTGSQNVAVGTDALVFNDTGTYNNAVGAFALFEQVSGAFNNAHGRSALGANVDGVENEAFGDLALTSSVHDSGNTAMGNDALFECNGGDGNTAMGYEAGVSIVDGSNNVCIGQVGGAGIVHASNVIAIGSGVSGVDSALGELDNSCYIGNIAGEPVSAMNFVGIVGVDSDGKLGTFTMDANGNKVPVSSLIGTQKQAMSNRKVEELQATVARQQKQIDALTAGLQRVSAQLELNKVAPQMVKNND